MSACRGEEYGINRAMHLCIPRFSRREIAQEMGVANVVAFKNLFTLEVSSILSIKVMLHETIRDDDF